MVLYNSIIFYSIKWNSTTPSEFSTENRKDRFFKSFSSYFYNLTVINKYNGYLEFYQRSSAR